jgi:uncharacterized MAPEG superfamily protein
MGMTWANWCVLAACVLPILSAGIAKWGSFGKRRSQGGFDNHDPRDWLARQEGYRKRANAAQANGFEALPLFIAGVLIAQQAGATQGVVDSLAGLFLLLRVAFVAAYVADKPSLRTLIWTAGFAACVGLFVAASVAAPVAR